MTTIYTRYKVPPQVSISFTKPTLTQQHFKDECDINTIMKRYETTGYLVDPMHPGVRQPIFNDFTSIPDLRECQDALIDANNRFMELPASVRRRFDNDVSELLIFLNNSDNLEEAAELGLINIVKPAAGDTTLTQAAASPDPSNVSGGAAASPLTGETS